MAEIAKKSLEQLRAAAALVAVQEWGKDWRKQATQRVKDLPVMVRNNGLGQTLAVLMKERGKRDESRAILNLLARWLLTDAPTTAYPNAGQGAEQLLKACFEGTRQQYQLAQQEAIAFLTWLKIIAEAIYGEAE
jgi:CRISPR-associated protein Cmr5